MLLLYLSSKAQKIFKLLFYFSAIFEPEGRSWYFLGEPSERRNPLPIIEEHHSFLPGQ